MLSKCFLLIPVPYIHIYFHDILVLLLKLYCSIELLFTSVLVNMIDICTLKANPATHQPRSQDTLEWADHVTSNDLQY